jgi:hypothetical protein
MTGEQETKGDAQAYTDEEMAWIGERLDEMRPWATGPHFLYWSLAIAFVLGLTAQVIAYLLRLSATGEPLGLAVDLLYTLGVALWTGVVVVVFAQVIPMVKQRQFVQAFDAYEAWRRNQAGRGRRGTSSDARPRGQRPG